MNKSKNNTFSILGMFRARKRKNHLTMQPNSITATPTITCTLGQVYDTTLSPDGKAQIIKPGINKTVAPTLPGLGSWRTNAKRYLNELN